jgi:hypothetical protein
MKQNSFKRTFAAIVALLFAVHCTAQPTAINAVNVTTKCLNCPPPKHVNVSPVAYTETTAYRGNAEGSNAYPYHVEIVNEGMNSSGFSYIKKKQFGFVVNHFGFSISVYWLNGKSTRQDEAILKIKKWGVKDGAKNHKETYYLKKGSLTVYYSIQFSTVVGYDYWHNDYPDAMGQFETVEGEITEF